MKKKSGLLALLILLWLPLSLAAQDAMEVLNNSAKAMGIDNVKTLRYTATGSTYSVGQSYTAGGPYPKFTIMKFVRDFDLDAFTIRQEIDSRRVDEKGGGLPINVGAEQTQVQYINRNSPWPAHVFMWLNPPGFIKGATMNRPMLTTRTVRAKTYNVVTVKIQDKYTVTGFINAQTNILERVETVLDNHIVLGDAPLDADFLDYKDFGGVRFPARIVHKMGLQPAFEFFITDFKANVPVNTQPPQGERGGGAPAGGQQAVQVQKIADGVFYVTGGTHYSVAVECKDYIVVIDAPLSEARSLAVIAGIKKEIPNKPIRFVVNTHHHFDHSNGLRTYVDDGATIITHPVNKAFYEKWWSMKRTLVADKLSQSKKKPVFETVSDRKVIGDGMHPVDVYVVKGNVHAEGMLMVYLPKEKVLVEADLYTPPDGATVPEQPPDDAAMSANLVQNIERLKLDVQQVLPLHGRIATRAELYKAAGKPASTD